MNPPARKAPANNDRHAEARGLARLLAPLPVSKFLDSYFNRKPLFVRGRSDKFDFLFREGDFARRIERLTDIRAVFPANSQVHIQPAEIKEMLNVGATICVTGIDKTHRKLADMARTVERQIGFSGRVDFRAYLSPPGAGFDLHYDARVATTLQIAGNKRWWYSDQPAMPFPSNNSPRELDGGSRPPSPTVKSPAMKSPAMKMKSVLLRPGDLLCLPAGVWHEAEADRNSSLALNMAFNYSAAGAFDFIVFALRRRLQEDPEWRRALVLGPRRRGKPVALDHVRERLARMQEAIALLENDTPSLLAAWNAWLRRP